MNDAQLLGKTLGEWQPMESAPTDLETDILLFDEEIFLGSWSISGQCWCGEGTDDIVEPSHWMPLPEPPNMRTIKIDTRSEGALQEMREAIRKVKKRRRSD